MGNLIRDILRDPSEYEAALVFLGVLFTIWFFLSILAVLSLRRAITQCGRIWLTVGLALIPLLLSAIGVLAEIPFSLESGAFKKSYDLHWMFILPLVVAGVALASVIRGRQRHDAVS